MAESFPDGKENIVGKGEIARNERFFNPLEEVSVISSNLKLSFEKLFEFGRV